VKASGVFGIAKTRKRAWRLLFVKW